MNRLQRLAALASVAVLGLAACGGDDDGDTLETAATTTTIPPAVTTTAPLAEEPEVAEPETTVATTTTTILEVEVAVGSGAETTAPPADDAGADDTPADEPADESSDDGGASCLEGAWIIDTEQLNSYYSALAANSGAGLSLGADGVVNLAFFDGDYQYAADFGITVDAGGVSGTGTATGTVTGTYTTADNVITATTTESSLNVSITVGGVTMDGSELGNDLITSAPINNAPFVCGAAGEGPTLMFQSGPSSDQRHPVVLKAF